MVGNTVWALVAGFVLAAGQESMPLAVVNPSATTMPSTSMTTSPTATPTATPAAAAASDPDDDADVDVGPDPVGVGPRLADGSAILLARIERGPRLALERLLEPDGQVVLHEIDSRSGLVHSCKPVGSLFQMRVLDQRPGPGRSVTQMVRDDSGALLQFAVGHDGEPRAVVVVAPAPPPLGIYAGSGGP